MIFSDMFDSFQVGLKKRSVFKICSLECICKSRCESVLLHQEKQKPISDPDTMMDGYIPQPRCTWPPDLSRKWLRCNQRSDVRNVLEWLERSSHTAEARKQQPQVTQAQ
jgi:hypothetical protein